MREIKFRAWDIQVRCMYYDLFLYDMIDDPINYHVMQFTGIKDKNGKEIYEGDIITYMYSYSEFEIVDCESPEQKIINTIFDISMFQGCESHFDIEVIGNIYENPELTGDKLK